MEEMDSIAPSRVRNIISAPFSTNKENECTQGVSGEYLAYFVANEVTEEDLSSLDLAQNN